MTFWLPLDYSPATQCFTRIRWELSPVLRPTILVPCWKAFKTASCVAYLKARGLRQECGFTLLVLQNHFSCRDSCSSLASYSLVLDYFLVVLVFECVLMAFISFIPFPFFIQTMKKGIIMRYFVFVYIVKLCRQLPFCLIENTPRIVKIFEIISFNLLLLSQHSFIVLV